MVSEEGYFQFSAKFWRTAFGLFLLAGFIIGFKDEIELIWRLLVAFFFALFFRPVVLPLTAETLRAILLLGLSTVIFFFGYLILLAWISRFVLPANTSSDRRDVSRRLRSYNLPFRSLHGPAVFFKEGKVVVDKDELDNDGQGVALLDLYSAVVLEQQEGNDEDSLEDSIKGAKKYAKSKYFQFKSVLRKLAGLMVSGKEEDDKSMVRALGPGLAFIEEGEKITDGADLRKQFRKREGVCCNTGDGIEVSTSISVVFTIGASPEILIVAKIEDEWKVVKLETVASDQVNTDTTQITGKRIGVLPHDLREEDKLEVEKYFTEGSFVWNIGEPDEPKSENTEELPFLFEVNRVVGAVYSRARDTKIGKLGGWTDLPADVAVEIFRNRLIHMQYDELYKPNDPDDYPMKKFKSGFVNEVKNAGILGYQIVRRKDGRPLEDKQACKNSNLVFSPPQKFTSSALLRDRGIKVLMASFGDLEPTNKVVRERFFDTWRARWQQEAEKTLADHELQATRIRNRERSKAQQDMVYSLSQILQSDQYTSEALVMRLYQALEAAATQPATQRLLPRDTIRMLWNLRQWLLPEERAKDEPSLTSGLVDGEETDLDE